LEATVESIKTSYEEFLNSHKQYLIVYGLQSIKSHVLGSLMQPIDKTCFVEGIEECLRFKATFSQPIRIVVESRAIWNVEPALLAISQLCYVPEMDASSCETIFRSQMRQLRVTGDISKLWKIFSLLHETHGRKESTSLLGMVELLCSAFGKRIAEHMAELDEDEQ
jgi:hypothetical protein